MADGVGHRHHGQPEGERDPEDPNAELRKRGAQERAPAAGEDQPERADRFCRQSICHVTSPKSVVLPRTMPVESKKRKGRDAPRRCMPRSFFLGPTCFRWGKLTMREEARMKDIWVKARSTLTTPETIRKRIKAKRRRRPLRLLSSATASLVFGASSGYILC